MVFKYTKKEIKHLLIVILVLTFVFAFNDGRETFELSYWLSNFVKVFFIVGVGIIVHDLGHDIMAKKHGFLSEFKIWGIKRLRVGGVKPTFPRKIKFLGRKYYVESLPIGIILAILVTLFSNGKLFWAAISSYSLIILKSHRLGRRFIEVTDFEEAKIAIAGSMSLVFFLVILKLLNWTGVFDQAIFIYSVIAVYDMLPLPGLDGFKVAMGSRPLFVFGFAFVLSAVLLVHYLSAVFALLLAVLISFVLIVVYAYFRIYK